MNTIYYLFFKLETQNDRKVVEHVGDVAQPCTAADNAFSPDSLHVQTSGCTCFSTRFGFGITKACMEPHMKTQ